MTFTCIETNKILATFNPEQKVELNGFNAPENIENLLDILSNRPRMKNRWIEANIHAALLCDLYYNLTMNSRPESLTQSTPWYKRLLFILLTIAGSLYALSAGFDGITAFLALFTSIPVWGIVLAGFLFSILSIAVFHGFDLVAIAENLDISLNESRQLLDVIADEINWIKKIKAVIPMHQQHNPKQSQKIIQALIKCAESLEHDRVQYNNLTENTGLWVLKSIVSGIIGIVFFSGGFFTGQSLALAVFSLAFTSISATFWPILLISIAIGLAAFSVYWFVERPQLENLVGHWFGRDPEKIALLLDQSDHSELENMLESHQRLHST